MFRKFARLWNMENSRIEQIRGDMRKDYGDKSFLKIYLVILVMRLMRALSSEVFIFLIFYASILTIPVIIWVLTAQTNFLLMSMLFALPVHYIFYTYDRGIRELIEDENRLELREELKIGILELKTILKNK